MVRHHVNAALAHNAQRPVRKAALLHLRLLFGRPPQAQAVVEDREDVRHGGARVALVLSLMTWSIMSRTSTTFLSITYFTSSFQVSPYLSLYDPFAQKFDTPVNFESKSHTRRTSVVMASS
jgi:hypothetical protein